MGERTFRFSISLGGSLASRPRVARRWVMAWCAELHFECASVNLPLLVSELVTNACVHGADPVTLRLAMSSTKARVEVEDSISEVPDVQSPTEREPGGRGLLIVDALSHGWGVEKTVAGGKVVWAEVLMDERGNATLEKAGCA